MSGWLNGKSARMRSLAECAYTNATHVHSPASQQKNGADKTADKKGARFQHSPLPFSLLGLILLEQLHLIWTYKCFEEGMLYV